MRLSARLSPLVSAVPVAGCRCGCRPGCPGRRRRSARLSCGCRRGRLRSARSSERLGRCGCPSGCRCGCPSGCRHARHGLRSRCRPSGCPGSRSGCRPGHGRANAPPDPARRSAAAGRHGPRPPRPPWAPHGRGRWCGSRRTTAQRRAARPAHPGGHRPCRPDDRPGGRPGPGARPVRTWSPARGRRCRPPGPRRGAEVVGAATGAAAAGAEPPDWRALIAVIRSPLRILAVPLSPRLLASPCSSARRMVESPPLRRGASSAAGAAARSVVSVTKDPSPSYSVRADTGTGDVGQEEPDQERTTSAAQCGVRNGTLRFVVVSAADAMSHDPRRSPPAAPSM